MPQIDQIMVSYASQIVSLLIVLGIIYFGIAKAMLPKIQSTIDARAQRIADDLAAADRAHETAEQIEENYRTRINDARGESNALTAEAKAQGAAASELRLAEADARLADKLAEAEAKLAKARSAALGEIESVAAEAAQAIVARIAGGSVSDAAARDAVKEAMAHG